MHPVLSGLSFGGFRKVEKQQEKKQSELELKRDAYEKMIAEIDNQINVEEFKKQIAELKDDENVTIILKFWHFQIPKKDLVSAFKK